MSHCIFNMSKSTCTIRMLVGLRRKGMAVLEGKQMIYMRGGMAYMNGVRNKMVNHRLWRIEEMLQEHKNFVRINRSEIVNLNAVDGFESRSALPLGLTLEIVVGHIPNSYSYKYI